jgi:hypothetical protein
MKNAIWWVIFASFVLTNVPGVLITGFSQNTNTDGPGLLLKYYLYTIDIIK